MKKFMFFMIIVFLAAPLFSQESWEDNRRIAITLDPNPMIFGLLLGGFGVEAGLEYAFAQQFAVKGIVRYWGFDPIKWFGDDLDGVKSNFSVFRANAEGRWYPSQCYVHGFFLNTGLQYDLFSASGSYYANTGTRVSLGEGWNTLSIYGGLGYKAVFGKGRVAFIMEPTLDFIWPLYSDIPFSDMGTLAGNLVGWALGVKLVRAGLLFGIAF